jgi:hypothetical protein
MLVQRNMTEEMSGHTCCGPLVPESAVRIQHLDIVSEDVNLSTQSLSKPSHDNFGEAIADLPVVAKAESSRSLRSSSS